MCSKVPFDKKGAISALNYNKKKNRQYRKEIRYYKCPECNMYHLTSKEVGETKPAPLEIVHLDKWNKLINGQ